jgi:Brp/Blh family beta-carotene 15,15'-monooxygenase
VRLPGRLSVALYLLWGAFVLGGPLLWHWHESSEMIRQLIGRRLEWPVELMATIQWGLLGANALVIGALGLSRQMDRRQAIHELVSLFALAFMFFHTPLLVGFAVYFSLWHSLGSLFHQVAFFRRAWPAFTLLQYYRQAAPYTIVAILGLWGLVLGQPQFFPEFSLINLFFILIACVTLPHIFLIEESFK